MERSLNDAIERVQEGLLGGRIAHAGGRVLKCEHAEPGDPEALLALEKAAAYLISDDHSQPLPELALTAKDTLETTTRRARVIGVDVEQYLGEIERSLREYRTAGILDCAWFSEIRKWSSEMVDVQSGRLAGTDRDI
ncbi:MAG: hypothetical protein M3N59_02635 [bacterium]|nr:hypothetical protein [bacterium]